MKDHLADKFSMVSPHEDKIACLKDIFMLWYDFMPKDGSLRKGSCFVIYYLWNSRNNEFMTQTAWFQNMFYRAA